MSHHFDRVLDWEVERGQKRLLNQSLQQPMHARQRPGQ